MNITIPGIGTATLAAGFANVEPGRERTLAAVYRQTRLGTRGAVLLEERAEQACAESLYPPAIDADDRGPSTAARLHPRAADPRGCSALRGHGIWPRAHRGTDRA